MQCFNLETHKFKLHKMTNFLTKNKDLFFSDLIYRDNFQINSYTKKVKINITDKR